MTKPSTKKITWIPSLMHANLFFCLDTKYAYSLWQDTGEFFCTPFLSKRNHWIFLVKKINIRNVLQSNKFVWNQSHIPNIMHPVSIHSNKHVLCAILNHYINEIKWILAKVFGTFRDIVISSVIKPRPFWVFWWIFFNLYIKTRRLVIKLNNSNIRKIIPKTLQAALFIKWLNIHTIHLKIESSFCPVSQMDRTEIKMNRKKIRAQCTNITN